MSYDTLDYPQSRPPKKEDDFADWSEETDLDSLDEELANLYKEIEDSVKPLEDYYQLAEETEYKERNGKWKALGGTLGSMAAYMVYDGINERYFPQYVRFKDNKGNIIKHKVGDVILEGTDKGKFFSELLQSLDKELPDHKIKFEGGELVFEKLEKVELDSIRAKVNEITYEAFREQLKDSGMTESEIKTEYNKIKSNTDSFLRMLEVKYGKELKAGDFMKEILARDSLKAPGFILHVILLPIFFTEVQKKGGNLDSYFKSASETALFFAGAKSAEFVVKKLLKNSAKGVGKFGVVGKVGQVALMLVAQVAGGGFSIAGGQIGAVALGIDKGFDTIFEENEDFFYKRYGWKNDSALVHIVSGGILHDVADGLGVDIGVPGVDWLTFWEHKVKFGTDKMDYLSVGLSRNKDAWNERVDEFASKLTTEIFEIITSDKSKATKREKIEKLFTIDGEDKPSGFREEIYDNVIALSDKWNEGDKDTLKRDLGTMVIYKVSGNMKITDESIKAERQQNNISKERLERILNGNGDTKVEKLEDISISWVREYFDTLSDTEKEYIRSYYKGTMARDFVAVGESEIGIYKKLIGDKTKMILETQGGEEIEKGKLFYQLITYIKILKREDYFLKRLEQDSITQATDLEKGKTQENESIKVERKSNGIEIVKEGKTMFIGLNKLGQLEYIKVGDKKFKPSVDYTPDSTIVFDKGFTDINIGTIFPFIFFDNKLENITFSQTNKHFNSNFGVRESWSIDKLFETLEKGGNFTLIEDYSLYFDLEMKIEK